MKNLIFILLFFGIATLFIGCSDNNPSAPALNQNNEIVSNSLQKGAPSSSGVVIRWEDSWVELWVDYNAGLVLASGAEDVTSRICSGLSDMSIYYIKDIISPSNEEEMRIIEQVKGEVYVSVWDVAGLDQANTWCEFFTNATLVASGMGNLRYNDNDYYSYAYDSKNHNSFGEKINGQLTTPGGEQKILNFLFHAVWDGIDFDNTYKENLKIQLK